MWLSLLRGNQIAMLTVLGLDGGGRLRNKFRALRKDMSVGVRGTLATADTRTGAVGRVGAVSTAGGGLYRIESG